MLDKLAINLNNDAFGYQVFRDKLVPGHLCTLAGVLGRGPLRHHSRVKAGIATRPVNSFPNYHHGTV